MVEIRAPAKINLGLVVGLPRPDGFHDLETLFCRITLHDQLTLLRRPGGIRLRCAAVSPLTHERLSCALPEGPENLAWQAAHRFLQATGRQDGVSIGLVKQIPVGAGLGGGSSDAAAVLKGMNRLFGRPLDQRGLQGLALRLGSDIPFFLKRSACRATGRGEILEPLRLPRFHVFLHVPDFPVNTARAYRELDRQRARRRGLRAQLTEQAFCLNIAIARLKAGRLGSLGDLLHNSFEEPVFRLHPELRQVKARFLEAGADVALLSGSGSALFALVRPSRVRRVQRALELMRVSFLNLRTTA
jgi:4-diphosphocytidyl-2-C-methyl-D-erythritol kinase